MAVKAFLSVDQDHTFTAETEFEVRPLVGDEVGLWVGRAPVLARVVRVRHQQGSEGSFFLAVDAETIVD